MPEWTDCAVVTGLMPAMFVAIWAGAVAFFMSWAGSEWSSWRLKRTSKRLLREHDAFWSDFNERLAEHVPPSEQARGEGAD